MGFGAARAAVASVMVVAVGLATRAEVGDRGVHQSRPAVALTAGVLSPRRTPDLLAGRVSDGRLAVRLAVATSDPTLGAQRQQSCLVVRRGGRTVFAQGADQMLIPASNLKLLTAAGVFARLDPAEQLPTRVVAEHPAANGVVGGPLYLIGGGDPLIGTADYEASRKYPPPKWTHVEAIADAVAAAGVHEVRGGVVGDDGRYDQQRQIPTWPARYQSLGDIGPMSALEVNDGFQAFAPQHQPATSPALHAATVLTSLLRARGVAVDGPPTAGRAPAGASQVASVGSLPVRQLVGEMLQQSDNDTAELLTKELGRRFGGDGTTAAGLKVLRSAVASAGLPVGEWTAVDGSGLDRSDRATCRLLLETLTTGPHAADVVASLPIAAANGTLAHRFVGHRAAGRLRAKTGSLDGVVALTGVFDGAPAQRLAFALLANGVPSDAAGTAYADGIADLLAQYPEGPPAADLAP